MTWFYCSFASKDEFFGSIVVQAETIEFAVIESYRLGINPGGEVLGYPLDDKNVPDEKYRNRVLTREECHEAWPGQMIRMGDYRDEEAARLEAEARIKTAKYLN